MAYIKYYYVSDQHGRRVYKTAGQWLTLDQVVDLLSRGYVVSDRPISNR